MHWVYMVECSDGTYYTGYTRNVKRRIKEHNESNKGAKYTRARRPVVLKYQESFETRQLACQREYEIKQFSRSKKEALIKSKERAYSAN
ncbi:MAG: GIY-YIG nuclease family protein [Turicibacter sp.]|nr:GIY-YIG nuclease family protein [Turicibacter sp.]